MSQVSPQAKSQSPPSTTALPPHKRHLRNYLLNTEYQLRFTLVIVGISGALTTGLGWLVYHFLRVSTSVMLTVMDPADPTTAEVQKQLRGDDRLLLAALVGFGVLLVAVLTVYGIIFTHKVAGPLFKISMYMNRIRDGRLGQVYDLRKGDQLVEFFGTFKQMHEALVKRTREEVATLDKAMNECEAAGLASAAERLRAVIKQKEESLGGPEDSIGAIDFNKLPKD